MRSGRSARRFDDDNGAGGVVRLVGPEYERRSSGRARETAAAQRIIMNSRNRSTALGEHIATSAREAIRSASVTLAAAVLGAAALVAAQLPWSTPWSAPIALLWLALPAVIASIVVGFGERGLRATAGRFEGAAQRAAVPATALALACVVTLGGAVLANLAFVDEPVEGKTLWGYGISAGIGLGVLIAPMRSTRVRTTMAVLRSRRALMWISGIVGVGLAALDAMAFPDHYDLLHRVLEGAALLAFIVAFRAALAYGGSRSRDMALGALAGVVTATAFVATVEDAARDASVRAAIAYPTVHRRVITTARGLADRDADGFADWLGGGDCDDDDPSAHPFSIQGDPCFDLPTEIDSAPLRRADDAVGRQPPRVIVLATIDAFRCGFGETSERAELRGACPEMARLGRSGLLRTDAHAVYPATSRSLAAIHGTEHGRLADVLGALGYHRIMIPATPLVIGSEASRGRYDMIRDDVHSGGSSARVCSAPRVTAALLESVRRAVREHERVFVWAHYFDPHAPYVAEPGQNLVLGPDLDRFVAEVRRTDAAIGDLARGLRDDPELSDAVLFVTSDHAEEFGEHGATRHGANLFETSTRIPMLAWRATPDHRAGLPNLLPAGGDQVGDYLLALASGRVFEARDEVVMRVDLHDNEQWAIVTSGRKLIYHHSLGYQELFDLRTDPFERHDLADERPDEAMHLLGLLHRHARRMSEADIAWQR